MPTISGELKLRMETFKPMIGANSKTGIAKTTETQNLTFKFPICIIEPPCIIMSVPAISISPWFIPLIFIVSWFMFIWLWSMFIWPWSISAISWSMFIWLWFIWLIFDSLFSIFLALMFFMFIWSSLFAMIIDPLKISVRSKAVRIRNISSLCGNPRARDFSTLFLYLGFCFAEHHATIWMRITTKIHKFPPSEIPDSGFLCSNPKSKQNTTVLTRLITRQAVTLNFLGRCFGLFS